MHHAHSAMALLLLLIACHVATSAASSSSLPQRQDDDSMCLERITDKGPYHTMVAHPDGSGRAFLSTLDGKIWLASLPGQEEIIVPVAPFLDLSDRVHHDAAQGLGLMGVAFHPRFAANGHFFISYSSGDGRCSELVVAEFFGKAGNDDHAKAARAVPSQVRRIFRMGLPCSLPHNDDNNTSSGQLLLRPTYDGYLYLVTENGGGGERSSSFLGKIIRFNVDAGSDPKPEIFATGLSSPRGCSFDSERPSDLYCVNVDQGQYEAVLLIPKKDTNCSSPSSSAKATAMASLVVDHGRLAAGSMAAPSITGGLVYRGSADPSLTGRYLYMYGSSIRAAVEMSGRYASVQIPTNIRCSGNDSLPCPVAGIHGRVLSFGQDSRNNALVLATSGVYRVVRTGLCADDPPPPPPPAPKTRRPNAWLLSFGAFGLAFALFQVYLTIFANNGQDATTLAQYMQCFLNIVCCNYMSNVTNINQGVTEGP